MCADFLIKACSLWLAFSTPYTARCPVQQRVPSPLSCCLCVQEIITQSTEEATAAAPAEPLAPTPAIGTAPESVAAVQQEAAAASGQAEPKTGASEKGTAVVSVAGQQSAQQLEPAPADPAPPASVSGESAERQEGDQEAFGPVTAAVSQEAAVAVSEGGDTFPSGPLPAGGLQKSLIAILSFLGIREQIVNLSAPGMSVV